MGKNWKVKYRSDIGCWYEDENENKSEPFRVACDYSCGFGEIN